ncbi:membrane protein, MarC family [Geotalea daltonii FRC-32]|uniref:UPF0056 inner membrane protein n=1 Tax=Geotalea daltonii (strain DSM 22248 / JCM 15807 / FRC-32) TaxID=316067 RepID=B9M3N7_GEODF|nr:MarC family protein [Geotalea daltonii]ACM21458.1 membrane protein, MarC family [Geotalea daltonii FRC-32]
MTFYAAVILLLLVMDPLGGIPFFISALKNVPEHRKKKVILRELLIALALMILFMFQGTKILKMLSISGPSLTIAGGIILLLIAIKMIFPSKDEFMENVVGNEPLIVPLAIPYVSGPSALITVTLIMSREPHRWKEWLLALLFAWVVTGSILIMCTELERLLGERGVIAIERLMGMILTTIAVEMTLNGIVAFLAQTKPA